MENAERLWRLMVCAGIAGGLSALMGIASAQRAPTATLGSGPFIYHTLDADFRVVVVTKGLVHPWGMAFLSDGSMLAPLRLAILRP